MSAPVIPDEPTDVPVVLVPDRAEAPISEITERFFRALLLKVPLDRIEELHLFSPLRQGGVETGIAVIAAREIIVPPPVADMELPLELEPIADAGPVDATLATSGDAVEFDVDAALGEPIDVDDSDSAEADAEAEALVDIEPEVHSDAVFAAEAILEAALDDASPYADDDLPPATIAALAEMSDAAATEIVATDDTATDLAAEALFVAEPVAAPTPIIRHTVFTARYRLVQKGPERGKWEADVVAEAEAPLITVETVVRGVQRRAGEESDTTRFTAAQIARALRIELPKAP